MIKDNSSRALKKMEKITDGILERFADQMVNYAKMAPPSGAPIITGNLRSNITKEPIRKGFRVFTETGYGGFVELGTRKRAANPYLRRAFDKTRSKFGV